MDLTDSETRAALTETLMERYAGRPVVVGPGILAARTEFVAGEDLTPIYLRETSFVKAPPGRVF